MRPRLAQKQAALLKTSLSRLARMEAGGLSVSLDLLVRGLFALGASSKDPKGSLILRSGLPETFELRLRSQQSASRGCSRTSFPLCDSENLHRAAPLRLPRRRSCPFSSSH